MPLGLFFAAKGAPNALLNLNGRAGSLRTSPTEPPDGVEKSSRDLLLHFNLLGLDFATSITIRTLAQESDAVPRAADAASWGRQLDWL